jgi:hypothetical protein
LAAVRKKRLASPSSPSPADRQSHETAGPQREAFPVGIDRHVHGYVAGDGSLPDQRVAKSREKRLQDLASARQQAMRMHRMRRALARGGPLGQPIAFEQYDLGESPAENTRCQQPCDAGAEPDGSLIIRYKRCHRWSPRRDAPSSAIALGELSVFALI